MIINHVKPVDWIDTEEAGVIQPSHVAALSHFVELEPKDIALLTGPAGPQGVQGAKGDRGDVGPAGADGAPGVAGAAGVAGLQGLKGDKGDAGDDGAQGIQGARGVAPAGAVLHFAMAVAPAGWLVCDGSLISRATYAELFAAVGVIYGTGDGSTTFKLPDLRGEFLRGVDGGRGVDVGRELGSGQGDLFKSHDHGSGALSTGLWVAVGQNYGGYMNPGSTDVAGGEETRPRNVAMLPCISTGA